MDKVIEKAKEELQMLETHHPHRFDYLKLELKSFISLLQSEFVDPLPTASSAATQASTSMKRKRVYSKRRKMEDEKWKNDEKSEIEYGKKLMRTQRDRVDIALEKAEDCLRKIQDFKFSLVC